MFPSCKRQKQLKCKKERKGGKQHGLTHLQELIEQTEGVSISQVIVAQPVLQFADITLFHISAFITTALPVTLTTLPLQFIHSASAQTVLHPAEK